MDRSPKSLNKFKIKGLRVKRVHINPLGIQAVAIVKERMVQFFGRVHDYDHDTFISALTGMAEIKDINLLVFVMILISHIIKLDDYIETDPKGNKYF